MLPNLPLPLPDETLYSWCHAVQRHSGLGCTAASSSLFGSTRTAFRHDFPARLGALTSRTAGALGEPAEVVDRRSILGFFLRTAEASYAQEVVRSVTGGARPYLKLELGLPASKFGCLHPLKSCAKCRISDLTAYGRSYWHWLHQLPSVLVCPLHYELLSVCSEKRPPTSLHDWLEPSQSDHPIECKDASRVLPVLTRLADDTAGLMNMPIGSMSHEICVPALRSALQQNELLSHGGHIRHKALLAIVAEHLKPLTFLKSTEILPMFDQPMIESIAIYGREHSGRTHPLRLLLLVQCLTDRWDDFAALVKPAHIPPTTSSASSERKSSSKTEGAIEHAGLLPLVQEGLSLSAAAKILGVSTTTATQWARQQNIAVKFRPKWLTERVRADIEARLGRGESLASISELCGASATSINRVLGANRAIQKSRRTARLRQARAEYRMVFLRDLIKKNMSIREIRELPNSPYPWLYRNDRDWLIQIINTRSTFSDQNRKRLS